MNKPHPRYAEVTEWLFNQIPLFQNVGADAYKPGLERVLQLSEAFGNPHLKLKTVHVAGTNGKGSTSSLLASVLAENADMRVGLFTSPHLVDFRERMRINGEMISEACVVDFIDRYRAMDIAVEPSFFELTTVMAFEWFVRSGVDVAVIETGLGGRLDSTNIIAPMLSVITNISPDHTALLGHTLPEIAREKAGIIKTGTPVVIGYADGAVREVFDRTAASLDAQIIYACDDRKFDDCTVSDFTNTYYGTPWGTVESPLSGKCQAENAATVFNALLLLPYAFSSDAVRRGFERVAPNTGLTGRWTTVSQSPLTITDTGHNVGGWQYTAERLKAIADERTLHMVVGFVEDKDISSILAMMPRNARYYFAAPSVKRGRPAEKLRDEAAQHGLQGESWPSVAHAYAAATAAAATDHCIFIGGSNFVVADFLNFLH